MLFVGIAPVIIWFALIAAGCYAPGVTLFDLLDRINAAFRTPMQITWNEYRLKTILVFLFLYRMGIGVYFSSRENRSPGEEYGSEKWGNVKSIARKYVDKNKADNIILSQNMRLGMNKKTLPQFERPYGRRQRLRQDEIFCKIPAYAIVFKRLHH